MKVNIGVYKSWVGPHQIADILHKVGVSEDRCYKIGEWLSETPLLTLCTYIESKRVRKVSVKVDKWDTWSMDHTLGLIILPMLKQLKATNHGAPGCLPEFQQTSNQAQKSFDFYKEYDDTASEKGHANWLSIMDKMIWSFEEIVRDESPEFWTVKPVWHDKWEDNWIELDNGMSEMKIKSEGILDRVGMIEYNNRVEEGLVLFGKHYRNLWD